MGQSTEAGFAAVVVAAGSGTRFGGDVPKQFLELDGATVLERAVAALRASPAVERLCVVVSPQELSGPRVARLRAALAPCEFVAGGATRAESVLRGLRALPAAVEYVIVHDAARPWVSRETVDAVVAATRARGAAVPLLDVPDTVKRVDGSGGCVEETLDRSRLRLAQTPQGARREVLQRAIESALAAGDPPTDEAAALERAGHEVAAVRGERRNRKITRTGDLSAAADGEGSMDFRVGTGFDVHRVDASRALVLGGVTFEGEAGLAGHSDADVVLHAAMDAVLGASGDGDIGRLFPPDDDRWAGADSCELAARVAARIDAAGFAIVNLDLMLLAERPKVGPREREMRERIAAAFGVDAGRIGLKATTLEKLGALGRGEGIACQAVALLRRRAR